MTVLTGMNLVLIIISLQDIEAYDTFNGSNIERKGSSSEYCQSHSLTSCPSWTFCNINSICQCYNINYLIYCSHQLDVGGIMSCNCLTFDFIHNVTEAGNCIFKCELYKAVADNPIYMALPRNITQLNKDMCGQYSRTGTLCGKCIDNTYTQVYSYNLTCTPCDGHWSNVIKYITSAFLPLTLFYILILFCSVNLHSSKLQGYVLFSQMINFPIINRVTILTSVNKHPGFKLVQYIHGFYGIWNLDFFRLLDHNICFKMSSLGILSLDYFIAVYPFLLTVLTYFATVYLGVSMQSKFRTPLLSFKRILYKNWNIKHSILDVFVTFTILSCLKVFTVSMDLLLPVTVYNIKSNGSRLALFYDSSIPYFSKEHLPYALLAILMTSVFVVFPTIILIVYPFTIFQRCLNGLPIRWQIVVRFVLDSIQGCYKNGTEPGTRDCRWFASVPYLVRLLPYLMLATSTDLELAIFMVIMIVVLLSILVILVEPYHSSFRENSYHLTLYFSLTCIYALLNTVLAFRSNMYSEAHFDIYEVCMFLVFLCTFVNFCYIILSSCVKLYRSW